MKERSDQDKNTNLKSIDKGTKKSFKKWFVLITKPRSEKKATHELREIGLVVYCPTKAHLKKSLNGIKKIEKPLISSIIFVNVKENKQDLVFRCKSVARYLHWQGKPAVVKETEIEFMYERLKNNNFETKVEHLKASERISFSRKPFKSQKTIVQIPNANSVQLILIEVGIKITIKN